MKKQLSELKLWNKNPRGIKKADFERLKAQIKKLGLYKPFIITPDGEVLGGNMRFRACKELGIHEVPVSVVTPHSEAEKLEYALSDNDRAGYYDEEKLAELLYQHKDELELEEYKVDLGAPQTLDGLLSKYGPDLREDNPDTDIFKKKIKSKQGELYQLGKHFLFCGDATEINQVMALTQKKKVDMIFTDPPYNVGYDYDWRAPLHKGKKVEHKFFNDKKKPKEYEEFIRKTFENAYLVSKKQASFYCWHGIRLHEIVKQAIQQANWYCSQTLIWIKNYPVLSPGQDFHRTFEPALFGWKKGEKHFYNKIGTFRDVINWDDLDNLLDIWYEKRDLLDDYIHPTQKPVRLAERAIKKSCPLKGSVLDLFGGSGSTLIACEQLKRQAYLMELDPIYCDAIRKRFIEFTKGDSKEWEKLTPKVEPLSQSLKPKKTKSAGRKS